MLIKCPFAPIDRNNSHQITTRGKFSRLIKTSKCRQFEDLMLGHLQRYEKDKHKFMSEYDENKHGIELTMNFYTPKLFTKKNKLNKKSKDCDAFKVPQDVLMTWLGIDDSQILKLVVYKRYAQEESFSYQLGFIDYCKYL